MRASSSFALSKTEEPLKQPLVLLRNCMSQDYRSSQTMRICCAQAKDGTHVHINGVGAAMGMSEVIYDVPRRSTVIANDTVEVFYLPANAFRHTMASNEEVRCLSVCCLR